MHELSSEHQKHMLCPLWRGTHSLQLEKVWQKLWGSYLVVSSEVLSSCSCWLIISLIIYLYVSIMFIYQCSSYIPSKICILEFSDN